MLGRLKIGLFFGLLKYALSYGVVTFSLGILSLIHVVKPATAQNLPLIGILSFLGLLIPGKGAILKRYILMLVWFAPVFVASQYIFTRFGWDMKGFTRAHQVYVGITLGLPLVLTLLTYDLIVSSLIKGFHKLLEGITWVLGWPFRKLYESSSVVRKMWSKFSGEPGIDVKKSLSEVDAFGNGDTYQKGRIFEEYVASIYRALGYRAMTTTEMRQKGLLPPSIQRRGGSGEQGVDVVVERDFVDPEDPYQREQTHRLLIQCKHYSSKVDNKAIQEIVTALPLYEGDFAAVITNNFFTEPAKELAHIHNVTLIDRAMLPELMDKAVASWKKRNEV